MKVVKILLIFSLFCVYESLAMRKQGVAVKGRLMCGSKPANNTKVKIVDIDYGVDPDDTLDEKVVGSDGRFELNGYTRELTPIDPVLYVWHDCRDGHTPCEKKITFKIPKSAIHNGDPTPEQWIDIGEINLESTFAVEERECVR